MNLIYALKDGRAVHVSEVESGLKCGCVCPACGEPLVAKKGKIMVNHFAHASGGTCEYGYESALHLAAKELIAKARKFTIPAVYLSFPNTHKKKQLISDSKEITVDGVELEYRCGSIIPDIMLLSGKKKLFVEIFVTHKVDECKQKEIEQLHVSTIQIDLSKCEKTITVEELSEILIGDSDLKKWIYNEYAAQKLKCFIDSAEKYSIVFRGGPFHVDNCPMHMRTWKGKSYANYIDDCLCCEYCISAQEENGILCTGKSRIAVLDDFNIPKEERALLKPHKEENPQNIYVEGHCPICGGRLMQKQDQKGIFVGCANKSFCSYRKM